MCNRCTFSSPSSSLWFSQYFLALWVSLSPVLTTKLHFNLHTLLNASHKWVNLCYKIGRNKQWGISVHSSDHEDPLSTEVTEIFSQSFKYVNACCPGRSATSSSALYLLCGCEMNRRGKGWEEDGRRKEGRDFYIYLLTHVPLLCLLDKKWWFLLDIFLLMLALQFEIWGCPQV